jgi:hypothetical protein
MAALLLFVPLCDIKQTDADVTALNTLWEDPIGGSFWSNGTVSLSIFSGILSSKINKFRLCLISLPFVNFTGREPHLSIFEVLTRSRP